MKEFFEDRRLKGALNVKCKNDDGSFRMWTARKEDVVANIIGIVEEYNRMNYNLTLRQLHYQMVTRFPQTYVNHQTAYKKLGCILDDCRYSGLIDWKRIHDRGRQLQYPYYERGVKEALEKTTYTYRLERQKGQSNDVEVWTEKDALSEIFWRSVSKYGIGLCVNKGYTSSSAIYSAYERFSDSMNNGKTVTILYFGDHDPSGLDMVRDIYERLELMFKKGQQCIDFDPDFFRVVPIGLTMQQIKKYKLPPNSAKLTDTRASGYIKKFGKMSWEVDALSPDVLTNIVETNIEKEIDMNVYKNVLAQEEKDIKRIKKIVSEIKK